MFYLSICQLCSAQSENPFLNIRLSFLIFPFTPLLSVEARTFHKFTVQGETNFRNTHGFNVKYYLKSRMDKDYIFAGTAFVQNVLLRVDKKSTYLPYLGYGYAHRFGSSRQWVFDSRIGLGATTNADKNGIYPVIKTGLGRTF